MNSFQEILEAPVMLGGEEFRCLFEHSGDAMFLENEDGHIVDVNRSACDLAEAPRSELTGRHASEILPQVLASETDNASPLRQSILACRSGRRSVRVLSTPVRVNDAQCHLVTFWLFEEGEEAEDPELSSPKESYYHAPLEAMEHMAGRLAHDFNNILTTITGVGSMIESDLESGVVRPGDVRRIMDATDDARSVTSDLLRFSGRRPPRSEESLDLNALIAGKEDAIRERAGDETRLDLELDRRAPKVTASSESLEEILLRLADNVREFAPQGGRMRIETSARRLGSHFCAARGIDPGDYAVVRVCDDGPGMPSDVAARAFEPFYTTLQDAVARGLGLSVVHGLVGAMNGHVELNTAPNEGVSISLFIPAAEVLHEDSSRSQPLEDLPSFMEHASGDTTQPTHAAPDLAAHETPQTSDLPSGDETILVVEDEPMVRELVTRSLGYLGYNVLKAENGPAGIKAARENADKIDMIFTDIVMPRMSGPEMVATMREQNLNFRVLFTTGFTDNKRILEDGEIREGVNLLPKPYTTRTLAERIRAVLDSVAV